jgi:hypothetical protein
MSDESRANVPHLHVHVPRAGVNLVGVNGGVLGAENLIGVALVLVVVQFEEGLVRLYLIEFNLGLQAGNNVAAAVEREVDGVVGIVLVEHKLFAGIGHVRVPGDHAAVETGAHQELVELVVTEAGAPGETGHRQDCVAFFSALSVSGDRVQGHARGGAGDFDESIFS